MESSFNFVLLLTVCMLKIAYLQQDSEPRAGTGSCPRLTTADIGSTVELSTDGLIAGAISPAGDVAPGQQTELVRVLESRIVCEASGAVRGEISSVSFITRYETCPSSSCNDRQNDPVERTEQFQFDCSASTNTFDGRKLIGFPTRTPTPSGDLSSAFLEQCGECTEPDQFSMGINGTHCFACNQACTGSGRCRGIDSAAQCCNYYLDGGCVQDCGSDLVPDPNTFDCVPFRCEALPTDPTYITTYSDNTYPEGSTASQSCNGDGGFVVPSGSSETNTRTCMRSGWSDTDIVCERFVCKTSDLVIPDNGAVTISPPLLDDLEEDNYVNAVATFTCTEGYELSENAIRTCVLNAGWDGTTPECTRFVCKTSDLVTPDNGVVTISPTPLGDLEEDNYINAVATFTCREGYELSENVMQRCILGVGWNGTTECVENGLGCVTCTASSSDVCHLALTSAITAIVMAIVAAVTGL